MSGGLGPDEEQKDEEHQESEHLQNHAPATLGDFIEPIHALAGLRSVRQSGLYVVLNASEGLRLLRNQRRHLREQLPHLKANEKMTKKSKQSPIHETCIIEASTFSASFNRESSFTFNFEVETC